MLLQAKPHLTQSNSPLHRHTESTFTFLFIGMQRYLGMAKKMSREALEQISTRFRALAEPTRLAILQELKSGERTVSELVEALSLSQANVSKQLSILREAGFLRREQRGTNAVYSIGDPLVMELCRIVCDGMNRRARSSSSSYSI
jgi:DNA-binding transcriptional ArsR family regulator